MDTGFEGAVTPVSLQPPTVSESTGAAMVGQRNDRRALIAPQRSAGEVTDGVYR